MPLGSHLFNFDPIFKIHFAYEHKLVLVSGAEVLRLKSSSFLASFPLNPIKMPPFGVFGSENILEYVLFRSFAMKK